MSRIKPLETQRLILRQLTKEDYKAAFENWLTEESTAKYMKYSPCKSLSEAEAMLKDIIKQCDGESRFFWGIEKKESNGIFGIVLLSAEDGIGRLAYCIGEKFWGKGYGTESVKAVIRFAFDDIRLQRVEGFHSDENMASGRVMSKCGLKYEGFAREKYVAYDGKAHDCCLYGLSKTEYMGKLNVSFDELIKRALEIAGPRTLSPYASAGSVAAALVTDKNNIYMGICIDVSSSLGFCAEHSAVAQMLANGESRVEKIVAVNYRGEIYPPCGRCRELLASVNRLNMDTCVLVERDKSVKLLEIMPYTSKFKECTDTSVETQRLVLKPLNYCYTEAIFENFTEDITEYMYPSPPKEIEETKSFVSISLKKMKEGKDMVFAILIKESLEFLGVCGIHNIKSGCPEIGIWTKKGAHGNGYGFEAASAAIQYIRENIPYNYILYPVDERNYASRRIPMLHGGQPKKSYEVLNKAGKMLKIIEYWIR